MNGASHCSYQGGDAEASSRVGRGSVADSWGLAASWQACHFPGVAVHPFVSVFTHKQLRETCMRGGPVPGPGGRHQPRTRVCKQGTGRPHCERQERAAGRRESFQTWAQPPEQRGECGLAQEPWREGLPGGQSEVTRERRPRPSEGGWPLQALPSSHARMLCAGAWLSGAGALVSPWAAP